MRKNPLGSCLKRSIHDPAKNHGSMKPTAFPPPTFSINDEANLRLQTRFLQKEDEKFFGKGETLFQTSLIELPFTNVLPHPAGARQ